MAELLKYMVLRVQVKQLFLYAIAEVQRNGGTAAFIDAEHALDPQYAEKLGVNIDELLLSQPDTGEQGLGLPMP